jgi:DNA-binding transcriptional ArsR family regulator
MLRIHFTGEDLARTRVAAGPEVGVELMFSLWALTLPVHAPALIGWRRDLRGRLDRTTALLFDLCTGGYAPDFLGPVVPGGGPVEVIEAIRATGRARLRTDIAPLAVHRHVLPPAVRRLAEGDAEVVRVLGDAVAAYHQTAISPHWARVRRLVDADRGRRARILLDGGVERLLATLHPTIRWCPPVLQVQLRSTDDFDVHLDGRGLVLQPAVFAGASPGVMVPPDSAPMLGYPVESEPDSLLPPDRALAALMGRTRATVLALIATTAACTTGEIARRLDISPASASTHATVLRNAGLIATERHGPAVLHMLTPRGAVLLDRRSG